MNKTLKTIIATFAILGFLLLCVSIFYYFIIFVPGGEKSTVSDNSSVASPSVSPTTNTSSSPKPRISITSISSPIPQGSNATVEALATAGAYCTITVNYKSGTTSRAEGLDAKIADSSGNVSWTWMIETNASTGSGTIIVTASTSGGTASSTMHFLVTY